jgi:hypothetical protein
VNVPPVAAPFLAATVLLGAAGVAKTLKPADTANALRAAGIPANRAVVRVGAVAEIGMAIWALIAPGPLSGGLVALAYTIFAVFVVVALRRGWALASCGCFGRPDTPPTVAHAALNAGAAASAVWWAAAWSGGLDPSRLGRAFFHQPWHGLPLVFVTLVVTGMAYLVWTNPLPAAQR